MLNEEIINKTKAGMKESNRVLIQELVADLEQKGISPAIAIDGRICNLKICHEQLAIFKNIITEFQLDGDSFCFMIEDRKFANYSNISEKSSYAVIVNKNNGRIKEYLLESWESELILDLQKGFWLENS